MAQMVRTTEKEKKYRIQNEEGTETSQRTRFCNTPAFRLEIERHRCQMKVRVTTNFSKSIRVITQLIFETQKKLLH